jgi:hypothetical protein
MLLELESLIGLAGILSLPMWQHMTHKISQKLISKKAGKKNLIFCLLDCSKNCMCIKNKNQ